MTVQSAFAAAASLVALAFAFATFDRWLDRRRPHELAWAVALGLFTLGSTALWLGASNGWDGPTFRAFYLLGAIVNVPVLALGTVYLLAGPRAGNRSALGVALACAFATGVIVTAPLHAAVPVDRLPQGSEVFGVLPRVLAAVASSVGALVILGGALLTVWRLVRGRRSAPRLVAANLLIAGGTLVLGAGGVLNSVLDEMEGFALTLVVGVTLLFVGFLVATSAGRPNANRPQALRDFRRQAEHGTDAEAAVEQGRGGRPGRDGVDAPVGSGPPAAGRSRVG